MEFNSSDVGGCASGGRNHRKPVSLDEELAQATSCLTVGPSPITKISETSFVMPPSGKLHPNLYNNSMRDISMNAKSSPDAQKTTSEGVPGFPDFPDIWMGESSHKRNKKSPYKKQKSKHRIVRKAVNAPFGSTSRRSLTKELKLRARAERKLHRLEKCIKLKDRRRRKRDMGDLCKGIAGMCK